MSTTISVDMSVIPAALAAQLTAAVEKIPLTARINGWQILDTIDPDQALQTDIRRAAAFYVVDAFHGRVYGAQAPLEAGR